MATFLFDDIVFGPVKSRRLGNSLGINLLPLKRKVCNFNCVYCECGWTHGGKEKLPSADFIRDRMETEISRLSDADTPVDVITFAGNGEPTMHPEFEPIIDHAVELRNKYFPRADIAVLTNATLLHKASVKRALQKVDMAILKFDSAFENTMRLLNQPAGSFDFDRYLENIRNFPGRKVIQTMFVRYKTAHAEVDNTLSEEIQAWLDELDRIKPDLVMIYSIARDTPDPAVSAVPHAKLMEIAEKAGQRGFKTEVS
jgi:wyosine [tRNA(Phe)-imidazoG37] synthetase (radical SAM superfamily)